MNRRTWASLRASRITLRSRSWLPPDSLACLEQRLYRGSELWPSLGELGGAHGKHIHFCPADDEPEIFAEETADSVLRSR